MANERTAEAIKTDLARVRDALAALEGNVDGKLTDYAKGGRTYDKTKRYDLLMKREQRLLEELQGFPAFEEMVIDDPDILD